MGANVKPGKFECDKCEFSCSSKTTLQRHVKQVHEGITGLKVYQKKRNPTTFQCEVCDSTFHTKSKLMKHKKTDHLGGKREEGHLTSPPLSPEHKKIKEDKTGNVEIEPPPFKCPDCNFEFIRSIFKSDLELQEEFKAHIKAHKLEDKQKNDEKNADEEPEQTNGIKEVDLIRAQNKEKERKIVYLQERLKELADKYNDATTNANKTNLELIKWMKYGKEMDGHIQQVKKEKHEIEVEHQKLGEKLLQAINELSEFRDIEEDEFTISEDREAVVGMEEDIVEVPTVKEFKCDECIYETENEGDLRRHKESHHNSSVLTCSDCGQQCDTQKSLENHKKYTCKDFACLECDFQTNTEIHLKNHMETSHHKVITHSGRTSKERKPCHNCDHVFENTKDLFKHRKEVHPSTQKCTYYNTEKGCKHGLDCLYIHEEMMEEATQQSDTNPRNLSPAHSCRICNESFSSKHELMKHRKKDHMDKVRPCRDFLQNVCHRGDSKCWYKHETNQAPNLQSQQGFPKLPASQHPPDQFQELKEMIIQLSKKVDLQQVQLEKQNQQKVQGAEA